MQTWVVPTGALEATISLMVGARAAAAEAHWVSLVRLANELPIDVIEDSHSSDASGPVKLQETAIWLMIEQKLATASPSAAQVLAIDTWSLM